MKYIHSWSGGKDSTASIILDHIHGLPKSEIIFSEVMFDKTQGISGELPEHICFIKNKAIPIFERWGYKVNILHSDRDYLDCFNHIIGKSKHEKRIGKKVGFPLGGMCTINRDCKLRPIKRYLSQFKNQDLIQYVGIAVDEPIRLKRLEGTNKVSLLDQYGYTEKMAYDLCKEHDLLSPIYQKSGRGGCWFCPNCKIKEFASFKMNYPELWHELEVLSKDELLISDKFKYGESFDEVNKSIDNYIALEFNQISMF